MRDYAKVEPKMWHGKTCKDLRKKGPKALLVGLYLMTSPSSNMLGVFNQPILYMAHETGLGEEGAMEGLRGCIEAGFCSYDEESETVFVHEMAKYQIAPVLKATDLRCKGIQKDYDALHDNPFLGAFFERYGNDFHMTSSRGLNGFKQAPSKPLPSQEQEQEQEQEQDSSSLRSEEDAPKRSVRQKREEITLAKYLENCKASSQKPIPIDHSIRLYCADAGITDEMLQVGWIVFKDRHLNADKAKKYKDWPGTFSNSVKSRWYQLWYVNEAGEAHWTPNGQQEKRVLESRLTPKESGAEHAHA